LGADVDEPLYAMRREHFDESVDGARGMADGADERLVDTFIAGEVVSVGGKRAGGSVTAEGMPARDSESTAKHGKIFLRWKPAFPVRVRLFFPALSGES
jgi:hypothetical protein